LAVVAGGESSEPSSNARQAAAERGPDDQSRPHLGELEVRVLESEHGMPEDLAIPYVVERQVEREFCDGRGARRDDRTIAHERSL
jgi:hypothetical protein